MNIIWKYLEAGAVKHQMYNDTTTMAICGVTHQWFVPNGWKDDKDGLDSRRECKLCPVRRARDDKKELETKTVQS